MNAAVEAYKLPPEPARSRGVWATAWRRLKNDRVGMASLAVVAVFVLLILLSSVGLEAAPGGVPDALALLLCVGDGAVRGEDGAHLRTTRGSATL